MEWEVCAVGDTPTGKVIIGCVTYGYTCKFHFEMVKTGETVFHPEAGPISAEKCVVGCDKTFWGFGGDQQPSPPKHVKLS